MTGLFIVAAACAPLCASTDAPTPAEVIDSVPPPPEKTNTAEVVESNDAPTDRSDQPRVIMAADGEAHPGCWFKLDGRASKDSSDTPAGELRFEWKQASGPLVHVTDGELHSPTLWLFLIQPGTYRFSLKVTNSAEKSSSKQLHFTVQPGRAFLTEAEGRKIVGFGEKVLLPGEGWRQVTGEPLDLRQEEEGAVFRPARAGLYIFEAPRAGDIPERRGVVVPPGREAPFGDRRPIAMLPKNLLGKAGSPVLIDASLSRDPDGPEETAQLKAIWITNEKHRGVEIEELPNLRARFRAPRPGTYEVGLVVSDGRLCSDPPEKVFIKLEEAEENTDPEGMMPLETVFEAKSGDVRLMKVKLGLWDNLDRAVQLFPARCAGVALRVDPVLCRPENFKKVPLALEVMDGALLHLVDWIGRQTDSVYRREEQVSFWFTRRDAWLKDEPLRPAVGQADALSKPDGSDLMELLKPWTQRILDERPGSSLIFYRESQSIVGTLPAPAAGRLKEIIAALHQPAGDGLPPPEPPSLSELKLRKILGQKTVTIKEKNYRLDLLLRDLARQAGVAIGMDPRQFPKGLPRLNLNIEDAPLRDALRTIIDMAGFDGCSVEAPDGLWLYRGAAPYPSSELLSDCAFVQAYDLSRLLPRIAPMSGELIAHAIQQRIYPDSWSDPSVLIFYHPTTGKLLVMHGAAVHRKILEFLWDLAERGEWALGPVEEGKK
jgi:hypothetical protein